MEKKEENYIRQLLLELDEYLFSLRWYDKEDREIMLKNIIGFDSIFQIIPKRFRKLLEGRIYTQEELDKAREEVADEVAREIGYGKLSGEEHYKTLNRVIKLISKLKDNK